MLKLRIGWILYRSDSADTFVELYCELNNPARARHPSEVG